MTDSERRTHSAFRLNLEQQKNRAKDLLKAAKAQEPSALSRITASAANSVNGPAKPAPRLADAQFVIARELGFSTWAELKSHIASLDRARAAIRDQRRAPDAELKTLHLRCGSDIRPALLAAGFGGDFLEHSYPYCHGPVTATPDHLEREARFIVESAGQAMGVSFEEALARRQLEERELAESTGRYERIVLWMEHDCFDQLVLLRCLAHYANTKTQVALELVGVNRFPGSTRFIGLGQLPAEALRLLWESRRPITAEQLAVASAAWRALTLEDPRPLAALMRTGCEALPDLSTALHRLLRELPAVENGLSLTEQLILQVLCEANATVQHLFVVLTYERDPLPLATDLMLLQTLERMQQLSDPLLTRISAAGHWRDDELIITDTGRAVLRGERDCQSLRPSSRWVGGVQICADLPDWRWDDTNRQPVLWRG